MVGPVALGNQGPLLLSFKDSAKALGISPATLYQLANQGDIEHVVIGSRKFVSREALAKFIEQHTHRGYYRAR